MPALRAMFVGVTSAWILSIAVPAATAQANWYYIGSESGAYVFYSPTTSSDVLTTLAYTTSVDVACQTRGGVAPEGTSLWDWIDNPAYGWVLDLYVSTPNIDAPSPGLPAC